MPRTEWIFDHPCQLVLTVGQIYWCKEVAASLESENGKQGLIDYQQVLPREEGPGRREGRHVKVRGVRMYENGCTP